jgi:hypothetical protein
MRRALLLVLAAIGLGGPAEARATEVHTVVGTLGYDVQRDVLPMIDVAIGAECVSSSSASRRSSTPSGRASLR